MANVNGNNNDDLFRQASDQYPLRTDSSDWTKLAVALDGDPSLISPPVIEQADKRRRKRFLWLLLLLPLGGMGYYTLRSGAVHHGAKTLPAAESGGNHTLTGSGTGDHGDANSTMGDETVENKTAERGLAAGKIVVVENKTLENRKVADKTAGDRAVTNRAAANKRPQNGRIGLVAQNGRIGLVAQNDRIGTRIKQTVHNTHENTGSIAADAGTNDKETAVTSGSGVLHDASRDPSFSRVNGSGSARKDIAVNVEVRAKGEKAPGGKGSGDENPGSASLKKTTISPYRHSFYAGILGAPDLSMIHLQSVKAVGSTFGVLVGYTFNSKWSAETGAYLDMKKYYTEGQYFSKKNVQPLRYVNLLDVNGTCNMVEIPVNVRYNLSTGKTRTWFATAGLSTYLMSKEWYAYHYLYYGNPMNNAFTYKNPYHYLFSITNLSFGFEQRLGSVGNLRVEPYLRVPLSGIGTGSLSIMSAGLNVGITRRIW